MGLWQDITGTLDHAAGSTDEAVGRATESASQGDIAGIFDNLAGNTDETFDQYIVGWDNDDVESAGEGIHEFFAWLDPTREAPEDTLNQGNNPIDAPGWAKWILDHQEEVAVGGLILALLWLSKPYAEAATEAAS